MTMRLCDPLGEDWPTFPVCRGCEAEIKPGQRYAIVPNTLTVLCAPCAGAPDAATPRPPAPKPKPARKSDPTCFGGASWTVRAPGQWSLKHAACVAHGGTEHPHAAHGLCTRCYHRQAEVRRREERRAAS